MAIHRVTLHIEATLPLSRFDKARLKDIIRGRINSPHMNVTGEIDIETVVEDEDQTKSGASHNSL